MLFIKSQHFSFWFFSILTIQRLELLLWKKNNLMIYQPIFSFFIIIQFYFRYKLINHYDKHPSMINHHQYTKSQQYGYVEHPPIRYNYHQPRSLHQPVATNDLYPIQQQSLQGKVHIFWESHKILQNLHLTFVCMYCRQK